MFLTTLWNIIHHQTPSTRHVCCMALSCWPLMTSFYGNSSDVFLISPSCQVVVWNFLSPSSTQQLSSALRGRRRWTRVCSCSFRPHSCFDTQKNVAGILFKSDRFQCHSAISHGVPQGSVLAPVLFSPRMLITSIAIDRSIFQDMKVDRRPAKTNNQ